MEEPNFSAVVQESHLREVHFTPGRQHFNFFMAYTKLHSSIVTSSLWLESDETRILFITLLALADANGIVKGSRMGVARVANIDPEKSESAWRSLLSSDDDSSDLIRSPENEGRRVIQIPEGFQIVNYSYYRQLCSVEDRQRQNREAKQRERSRQQMSAHVITCQHGSDKLAHAEAEAEADAEEVHIKSAARTCLAFLNEKTGKAFREVDSNLNLIIQRLKEPDVTVDGVKEMILHQVQEWGDSEMAKYLRPETLFRKGKFDGYYGQRKAKVIKKTIEKKPYKGL